MFAVSGVSQGQDVGNDKAFALGALLPLRADGTLDEPAFKELHDAIEGLQTDVFAELCRFRRRRAGEC